MSEKRPRVLVGAVAALGIAVLLGAAFTYRHSLLREWHSLRLRRTTGDAQWEMALSLERAGAAAREAAENWYLSVLEDAPSGSGGELMVKSEHVEPGDGVRGEDRRLEWYYLQADERQMRAALRVAALGSAERAVPILCRILEESNPDLAVAFSSSLWVRQKDSFHFATFALYKLGAPAVPALAMALRSEKAGTRRQAALALDWLGREAAPAAPALLGALRDVDIFVRNEAMGALRRLDPEGKEVVPVLLAMVETDREPYWVVNVLAQTNEQGVEFLCRLLERSPDHEFRRCVARAFSEHRVKGATAARVLLAAVGDPDSVVRFYAIHALHRTGIEGEDVVAAFIARLVSDPDIEVRQKSALALGDMRAPGLAAIQALREASTHESGALRKCAARALAKLGDNPAGPSN